MKIDPMTVALCTPTYDCKMHSHYVLGLSHVVAQRQVAMPYFVTGCSSVSRARNFCVHWFLHKTQYEHMVFVDADIGFGIEDWELLLEDQGEDAVCAEYMKKDPDKIDQVSLGLGFARISRALLMRMADEPREGGGDLMARYREYGEEWIDYFPQGVNQMAAARFDEDRGFWSCAGMVGAIIRAERRTNLTHYGEKPYRYTRAPDKADCSMYGPPIDITVPTEPMPAI